MPKQHTQSPSISYRAPDVLLALWQSHLNPRSKAASLPPHSILTALATNHLESGHPTKHFASWERPKPGGVRLWVFRTPPTFPRKRRQRQKTSLARPLQSACRGFARHADMPHGVWQMPYPTHGLPRKARAYISLAQYLIFSSVVFLLFHCVPSGKIAIMTICNEVAYATRPTS